MANRLCEGKAEEQSANGSGQWGKVIDALIVNGLLVWKLCGLFFSREGAKGGAKTQGFLLLPSRPQVEMPKINSRDPFPQQSNNPAIEQSNKGLSAASAFSASKKARLHSKNQIPNGTFPNHQTI